MIGKMRGADGAVVDVDALLARGACEKCGARTRMSSAGATRAMQQARAVNQQTECVSCGHALIEIDMTKICLKCSCARIEGK